jgi:P-type E1-E2 ATPase
VDHSLQDLEREFSIVGSTGIEDKLQESVKQSIQMIKQAGIMLWVLTGDRRRAHAGCHIQSAE